VAAKGLVLNTGPKNKGVFPDDKSIQQIVFLALRNAAKKWTYEARIDTGILISNIYQFSIPLLKSSQ